MTSSYFICLLSLSEGWWSVYYKFDSNKNIKMQTGVESKTDDIVNDSAQGSNPEIRQDDITNTNQAESKSIISPEKKSYFSRMLQRHSEKVQLAQVALEDRQQFLSNQILEGKYDIKRRPWPEPEEDPTNNSKFSNSVFRVKKQLQQQLANVESRLLQQNSERVSRVISNEDRMVFLKKMQQERKQLMEKKKETARLQEQKRLEEEKKLKEELQKADEDKKNKRKQELMESLKALEEQRKARAESYAQQEAALKEKIAEKILADKIQGQYILKQNQFLEEKKKRLAEIRNLHKPIDKTELEAHSQKYEQWQHDRAEAVKSRYKKTHESAEVFYKSAFYKKVEKEERIFLQSKHDEDLNKLKEVRDKLKRFSEHVRNDYRPSIDDKKVEEMKFRSNSLKRRALSVSQQENQRKLGLRYLEYSKIKVDHQKLLAIEKETEEEEEEGNKKNIDYLAELREKNKGAAHSVQGLMEALDRKGCTKQEKAKKIMQYTQRLELKAKRKEEVSRLGGPASEELDDLYLQAIEAKLSLLENN